MSRAEGSDETWALRLVRGSATAHLERERRRARSESGTTVYLADLDPDVLRLLTQRKVVDYLRTRRSAALARGDYVIEVIEGRSGEVVTPEKPEGISLDIAAQPTLWGRIEFSLYVAPPDGKRRRVAVVGRAGTTIVDDLGELDEFAGGPWTSDQRLGADRLRGAATVGRTPRDPSRPRRVPGLPRRSEGDRARGRTGDRTRHKKIDAETADRLADTVRRIFGTVLSELADLDNPMRTPLGDQPGDWRPPRSAPAAGRDGSCICTITATAPAPNTSPSVARSRGSATAIRSHQASSPARPRLTGGAAPRSRRRA